MENRKGVIPPSIDHLFTLKVDNIPNKIEKEDLMNIFQKYGQVGDIYIPRLFNTYEPKGFAFVRFINEKDAAAAQLGADGFELDKRILRVQEAKEKRPDHTNKHNSSSARSFRDNRVGHQDQRFDSRGRDNDRRDSGRDLNQGRYDEDRYQNYPRDAADYRNNDRGSYGGYHEQGSSYAQSESRYSSQGGYRDRDRFERRDDRDGNHSYANPSRMDRTHSRGGDRDDHPTYDSSSYYRETRGARDYPSRDNNSRGSGLPMERGRYATGDSVRKRSRSRSR